MQKQQENVINKFSLTQYYIYTFKQVNNLNSQFGIIKKYFNFITNFNYNKIIIKLITWFKLTKTLFNKYPKLKKKTILKRTYKQIYFNYIFTRIHLYFYKTKSRFLFKKTNNKNIFLKNQKNIKMIKSYKFNSKIRLNKSIDKLNKKPQLKLIKFKLWFFKLKKKKKIPKWKLDKLYSFKKFFLNFSIKYKLKKITISQIKLIDYTLRSKFKMTINIENIKSQYGVIKIKPSGANIFITLTNFYGNVFIRYPLVFLMKSVDCNKRFKGGVKTARPVTCI